MNDYPHGHISLSPNDNRTTQEGTSAAPETVAPHPNLTNPDNLFPIKRKENRRPRFSHRQPHLRRSGCYFAVVCDDAEQADFVEGEILAAFELLEASDKRKSA